MAKCNFKKKGVILFMVLAILLIVSIVINGILNFVLSNYYQTFHRARRVKAYYAAMAGINLAIEKLRRGDWQTGKFYKLCNSCSDSACNSINCPNNTIASGNLTDLDMPFNVTITITGTAPSNITATVDYAS